MASLSKQPEPATGGLSSRGAGDPRKRAKDEGSSVARSWPAPATNDNYNQRQLQRTTATTTRGETIAGFAGLTGLLAAEDDPATSPGFWEQPLGTLPTRPEQLFPSRSRGATSFPVNPAILPIPQSSFLLLQLPV